jgi:hypothetical protein
MSSSDRRFNGQLGALFKPERMLLVCVALGALLVIRCIFPLIISPYQIDYGEGLMLDGALRIRHAQPLYPDSFGFPIVLHVYGPVAYAVAAAVLPADATSFAPGRLLIVVCSIALSLLLAIVLRRLTGSWWIGLSFGLQLLTLPAFRFWFYLLRADVIGVLFSMIGIVLYLLGEKFWYWSVPFFGLALFCKYSLLAAPVAVFAHLLLSRKMKEGFVFAIGLCVAATLAFVILQFTTGGWFAFHMFSTHPDRYSMMQFVVIGALVAASAPVVTALAVWYAAHDFHRGALGFAPIYLVVSTISALTAGKLGSTTNHFVEWMVPCCLCAGLGYSLLLSKYAAKAAPLTALLSASILTGVVAQNRPSQQPSRELEQCNVAYRFVNNSSSSRVLSETLGPILVARKPILMSDPFVYGQLVKHGSWPNRRVEDLVNEQYFDLIVMSRDPAQVKVLGSDAWSESLAGAIGLNYRVVDRFSCRGAEVMLEPTLPNRAH